MKAKMLCRNAISLYEFMKIKMKLVTHGQNMHQANNTAINSRTKYASGK